VFRCSDIDGLSKQRNTDLIRHFLGHPVLSASMTDWWESSASGTGPVVVASVTQLTGTTRDRQRTGCLRKKPRRHPLLA